MPPLTRVLATTPVESLDAYRATGGGHALEACRRDPDEIIAEVEASGIGGRGGAGFSAGRKWRTVRSMESPVFPASVVVNAAEGEPGSFKDRAIIRANPYHLIEGALVAARAVDADRIVIGMKRTFTQEVPRVQRALDEVRAAGWADGLALSVFAGPSEYLYGEETALLETIDGRYPFPRIAPPYRRGVEEIVEHPGDVSAHSASAAHVEMAARDGESVAPPTLASNVETYANVPGICVNGADWFRSVGTEGSPGTIVCTITGRTQRHGVGEFPMGTPLREVIETIGGGAELGHRIVAALSGVSNPILPVELLDTPMSHEAMRALGSGLGTGGYIVFDDRDDLVAVAAGVSRFLGVESCGQCTPCKQDGLAISERLRVLLGNEGTDDDLAALDGLLDRVTESARCNLAYQQHDVVDSILELYLDRFQDHVTGRIGPLPPEPIVPILDIVDGRAVLDLHAAEKQPDWSFEPEWNGKSPADRLDDHRAHEAL